MKRILFGMFLLAFVCAFTGLLLAEDSSASDAKAKMAQTCYVCATCHTMAMKPGDCPSCGAKLAPRHLLMVKDNAAYCCACGADCKCEMKRSDASTCSCGKPVEKVDLKGMYVCGCAPDCKMCEKISDKPGKCSCGMERTQVK